MGKNTTLCRLKGLHLKDIFPKIMWHECLVLLSIMGSYMTFMGLISYTHSDPTYAKYAFSWCVSRHVETHVPSPAKSHGTRSGAKRRADEVYPEWPAGGGGSFVDVSLKVVVKGAKGTMTCFLPEEIHGTARLCGVHKRGITIAFSAGLAAAYKKAQEGMGVEEGAGVGQGDPDAF